MKKTHWRREQVLRIIGMDARSVRADAAACDGHRLGIDERPPLIEGVGVECAACQVMHDAALEGRSRDVLSLMGASIETELRSAADEHIDAYPVQPSMRMAAEAGFYLGRLAVEVNLRREAELAAAQMQRALWAMQERLEQMRRRVESMEASP